MKQLLLLTICLSMVSTITACGTLPVPDPIWPEARDANLDQSLRSVDKQQVYKTSNASNVRSEVTGLPQLRSARAYWRYAVERLQQGDVAGGHAALDRALEISPRNRVAHKLLRQMEIDPLAELGEQYFLHRIAPGESLSELAKKYLNDSLQFYLLARYNNIDRPNTVSIGQLVRIPGTKPAESAIQPTDNRGTVFEQARVAYEQEDYELTIQLLEPFVKQKNGDLLAEFSNIAFPGMLARAYAGLGLNALEEGNRKFAVSMYISANKTDYGNTDARKLRDSIKESLNIDAIYRQANHLAESDPQTARGLLGQVVLLSPGYRDAEAQLKVLDTRVKRLIYREALRMQRGQNLDEAIALWDKLLLIEPGNENARLYRARAVELKENLQKFVSGG